ncbi:MAG: polysaccharide biosynthesis protein [Rhodospirillales bacterium]|nr:polysaccharide biosynthesis protein [Rhodospirillales bacterium]
MLSRIPARGYIAFIHDIFMAGASFLLSLYLRFGEDFSYYTDQLLIQGTIAFSLIAAGVFWFMGLYRGVWRYASMNDLIAITRAVSIVILIFLATMFLWIRLESLPRSIPFINWFVLMALLGGPRFLYRLFKDRRIDFHLEPNALRRVPVLLVGAGDSAELFIRSLTRSADANYRVVGILSETEGRVGRRIHGVGVLGVVSELNDVVHRLDREGNRPQRLILTKDDMDGALVRSLLDISEQLGMTISRLPQLTDFKSGLVDNKVEVRPIALEDLLGRPQTPLDRDSMRALIENKRVLITGAGGSIGGELVRQIAGLRPASLVLVDNSEFNLYAIDMELGNLAPDLARRALIADVRDPDRIGRLFRDVRPDLVFHAAALKHVPLVEENVIEGLMTNAVGSANVADACVSAGVGIMVLISTDKAVNPTSVMGASKRVAESYCQALDRKHAVKDSTRFVAVRFGNVLGSTGSVVPLFQKQLAAGGPLTVTHPDMKRYFMTVREAVELVLEASALGSGGKHPDGNIFVLDMGEPVRIFDLANQVIRLAGLVPGKDIKVEFIGLRPGEKLFEEVFHDGEALVATEYSGILLAAPRAADLKEITRAISDLKAACEADDQDRALQIVRTLVPEYRVSGDKRELAAG